MSEKFALIVANTEYMDTSLAKLSAPGKDAEDFARVLKDQNICAFDDVKVLLNQPEHIVRRAIEVYFDQRKPSDLVVLYFSGHGIRDEMGALYLAVKNTVRSRLRSTAIKSDYIREIMGQSRSKRQVLILDCCNSGAFAQGTKAATGASMGFATAFEGTGYGHIVLTASDSTQFAWEGDKVIGETDNSLFTHFLVKGLEGEADQDGDGTITIDELYDYAYEQIVSCTPKQTPGKWSYKQQGEIVLRQRISAEDTRPVPLPPELVAALENMLPYVREGAVKQLGELLKSKKLGLARTARATLEKIANEDDSRYVASAAKKVLESSDQVEGVPLESNESKTKAEAEELARKKLEEESLAQKKADAIRIARERELQLRQSPPLSVPITGPVSGQKSKRSPIVWMLMIFSGLAVLLYITLRSLSAAFPSVEEPVSQGASTISNTNIPANPAVSISMTDTLSPEFTATVPSPFTEALPSIEPTSIPPVQIDTDRPPAIVQPSGKIVFTCQKYKDSMRDQICVMNADGSNQRMLTDGTFENFYGTFAPDGQTVVFSSNRVGNSYQIYEVDLAGNITQLSFLDGDSYSPEIAPNNKNIVFVHHQKGENLKIWIMDRNGDNAHEVYAKAGMDIVDATWSPDGNQILFALGEDEYNKKLYTVNKDGSNLQLLSQDFLTRGRSDWSPNGQWIASYALTDSSDPNWFIRDIFMMNSDGTNIRQLTFGQNTLAPSFSPDSQWITFTGYMHWGKESNGCEIYVMHVDGTDMRRLTSNSYCDWQPRWGP